MTAKDQTNWSPEQLEEWARPALEYPELVEIARTATSNNQAKNEALAWITKIHEPLGQACRWLHILRAKYPERFEKLISQTEQKPKEEKEMREKDIRDIEFELPETIELITRRIYYGVPGGIKERHKVRFAGSAGDARRFCMGLLDELVESPERQILRDEMIQILEEKYGLKVKICGNCKYFELKERYLSMPSHVSVGLAQKMTAIKIKGECKIDGGSLKTEFDICEHWAPKEKEVSEMRKEYIPPHERRGGPHPAT